jgi:cell division protein FtsB
VWSEFGLLQHYTVGQELASKQQELISMRSEIDSIKQEIACWKSDPFYLEKMAREELGMGYKNEVMYLTR